MTLLKSFSEFLLEKSSSDGGGIDWPLKYKSEVNDKERELSEEYLTKIFKQLDASDKPDLVSSEYEALYQLAKSVFGRKISDILDSSGANEKEESALREYYNSAKKIYEEKIGDKKIKDFSKEEVKSGIIGFYKSLLDSFKKSSSIDDKSGEDQKALNGVINTFYGSKEAGKLKEMNFVNLFIAITDFIEGKPVLDSSILKKVEELKKQSEEFEKAVDEGGKNTIANLLQQILYCLSSSYGCLAQINRLTFISSGVDRAKKEELLGKYTSLGTVEKEGTIYKNIKSLSEKFKNIKEKGVKDLKKSYFIDPDNTDGIKYLVVALKENIKELQKISDDSVMTQEDWEKYVEDKKLEGYRYQDLKDAFGLLQSSVNNYCTGENEANALDLYYRTLEDYIKGK